MPNGSDDAEAKEAREVRRHNTEQVWQVVTKHGEKISGLEQKVEGLQSAVSNGFESLRGMVANIQMELHRPAPPSQIPGYASALIALLALMVMVMGSVTLYVNTRMIPIDKATEINRQHSESLHRTVEDIKYQMGYDKGRTDMMEQWLRNIDNQGLRRSNAGNGHQHRGGDN